jgi:succinyl-diaminopimelate desuccinylase
MKDVLNLAQDLVEFASYEREFTGDMAKCINYCSDFLGNKNCRLYDCKDKRGSKTSLVSRLVENPELFFVGHLDVIPANMDQFRSEIRDGRLYGRGSCDMKGSVAVFLDLMKKYSHEKNRPSVGLILTTDEEIGGERGAKYLLHELGLKCKFAIIGEPTDLNIATKEKPVLQFVVNSHGKSVHGAVPYEGENAIDILYNKIENLKKRFNLATPENFWKPTFNLGVIKGGEVPNKVPNYAEAEIDIRYTENESKESIIQSVKELFHYDEMAMLSDMKIKLDVSPMRTDPNNLYVLKLKEARRAITGKNSLIDYSKVYSDGRFFSEVEIPCVSFGPIGANAHGENEWVDIESLNKYRAILKKFIGGLNAK